MGTELDEANARIARLERSWHRSRRMNSILVLGLIATTAVGAMRASTDGKVLEAEQFVVRDKHGKVRGRFGLLPAGPGGLWSSVHSEADPEALLAQPSPGLLLYDANEKPRLEARAVGSMAFVSVYQTSGSAGATLGLHATGSGLSLFGAQRQARLTAGPLGARLEFEGLPGTGGLTLADTPGGTLFLKDEKGNLRVMLAPDLRDPRTGSAASIVTFDASGNPVSATP